MGVDMMEFKIVHLETGGFIVKDAFFDNVFASTRIDEALVYVRDKMTVDARAARKGIETHNLRQLMGAIVKCLYRLGSVRIKGHLARPVSGQCT
jgi:hypothetical protein